MRLLILPVLLAACAGDDDGMAEPDFQFTTAHAFGTGEQVWIAGETELAYFDGTSWARLESNFPGGRPWAASADDFWVASDGGLWRSTDTLQWSAESVTLDTVEYVFGSGPADVWVSGTDGSGLEAVPTLLHWDGIAWTTNIDFRPLVMGEVDPTPAGRGCSYSAADVWFALQNPQQDYDDVLLHWDGVAWTVVDSPGGVLSPSCDDHDLWLIAGNEARGLHRLVDEEWIRIELPTEEDNPEISFRHAAGTSAGEAWLAASTASPANEPHLWHVTGDVVVDVPPAPDEWCPHDPGEGCFNAIWSTASERVFAFTNAGAVIEVETGGAGDE